MADNNLFQELNDVLQEFKTFLDSNVPTIAPAIQAIASLVPQITDLLDQLIGLMNDLKSEIQNLDVSAIPGLAEATEFITMVKNFLDAAKNLLPEQGDTIDEVLAVADVVGGLSGLDDVKQEILDTIDAIVAHLNSLKPA
jgi:ABC-type transporter Mla subunit MlaD